MAPPPPLDLWKSLPALALREVARRVRCEVDRTGLHLVCRPWHEVLAPLPGDDPPLPELPLLLRPFDFIGPRFSCLLSGWRRKIHRLRVPDCAKRGRWFGSYEGRWVFLARGQIDGHALVNLHTGDIIALPDEVPTFEGSCAIAMRRATLSSPPGQDGCVGAAITQCAPLNLDGPSYITFWNIGESALPPLPLAAELGVEDVAYHDGAFHFVTRDGGLLVCRPGVDPDGALQMVCQFLPVPHRRDAYDDSYVRYLLVSRGELLMVVKWTPRWTRWTLAVDPLIRTWRFTLFRSTKDLNSEGALQWTMMHQLGGRMLFLGRGHSRSFDVADFRGFEEGIYFLDDMYDNFIPRIVSSLGPRYSISDNGKWTGPPPAVDRCFMPEALNSYYSPGVWVLA